MDTTHGYQGTMLRALLLVAALPLAGLDSAAADWNANTQFVIGRKSLSRDDWPASLQEQTERGFMLDVGKNDWPVNLVFDYFTAQDSGQIDTRIPARFYLTPTAYIPGAVGYRTLADSHTEEVHLGLRKYFHRSAIRVSLGAGLSLAWGELSYSAPSEVFSGAVTRAPMQDYRLSDRARGVWISGGIDRFVTEHVSMGLQFKSSYARGEFAGQRRDFGGSHLGLSLGYHWE